MPKPLSTLSPRNPQAVTYEEFAALIYGPRLSVGGSPREAQELSMSLFLGFSGLGLRDLGFRSLGV